MTQNTHSSAQIELERALEMAKHASEIKRAYRQKRDEALNASIPKVIPRKIRMIDPMTDETWNSGGNLSYKLKGTPSQKSNMSSGSQDAMIEKLR